MALGFIASEHEGQVDDPVVTEDMISLLICSIACWLFSTWRAARGSIRFLASQDAEDVSGEKIVEPWT